MSRRWPGPSPASSCDSGWDPERMPDTTVPGGASAPELRAHLAVPPAAPGPWPGVVVIHELFGLTDDIREQAGRLAAAGYLAVAPDLFSAGGRVRCIRSV